MPLSFHTSRRAAHPASDMFALVADVEKYPQFVPLCSGSAGAAARASWRPRNADRAHDRGLQAVQGELHLPRGALSPKSTPSWSIISMGLSAGGIIAGRSRRWARPRAREGVFLDSLRVQEPRVPIDDMRAVFDHAFRKFADAFEARANAWKGKRASASSRRYEPQQGSRYLTRRARFATSAVRFDPI